MDLSREIDGYIKETIDHSLGLPISMDVLQKKLQTAEESQRRLREQYLSLVAKLKEKDQVIDLVKSEASMNAQALKKFVEENKKLSGECEDLVNQCKKWEKECFLYHQDREALMDFGNESDEKAREAESRVKELEEEVRKWKSRIESENSTLVEEDCLIDSVLGSLFGKDESVLGRMFLEANIEDQCCETLLVKWDELKPSTRKVMSLISMLKKVEKEKECLVKEKECLVLNLGKAEQEVEAVCKQNRELDRENRKLLKQCSSSPLCSAEKSHSNKRKSPKLMMSSPNEKRIELSSPGFTDA